MVLIHNFDLIYDLIKRLKDESISHEVFNNVYEHFTGARALTNQKPDPNTWTIKIAVLSLMGTLYYEESIKLSETDKISYIKSKLVSTVPPKYADISVKDGNLIIK